MTDDHNVACTINQLWDMTIGPDRGPAAVETDAAGEGIAPREWIRRAVQDALNAGIDFTHPNSIVHSDEDAVETLIAACFMGLVQP